jgi:hypothetical protein
MSESGDTTERHTPYATFEAYALEGVAGSFAVDGIPLSHIQLSPVDHQITLLVQATDDVPGPDLQGLANLDYYLEDQAGTMWHRLDATYEGNLAEIYPVLCAVVDRVQLKSETFAQAVAHVLTGLSEILAGRGGLSLPKQIGLFGELTVLLALAAHTDAMHAVNAWRGPDREEHDFGLTTSDLEIKTTISEKRSHWINGLNQLARSPGRPLYVVSIQLTAPGVGSGASLAELVQAAYALPQVPTTQLDLALESAGYYSHHQDLYRTRWRFRSRPEFFLVDDRFPALTAAHVFHSVAQPERIDDVRYRIGLDGLPGSDPLFAIDLPGLTI